MTRIEMRKVLQELSNILQGRDQRIPHIKLCAAWWQWVAPGLKSVKAYISVLGD